MRVLSVVGNRPQFIKSAPLSVALRQAGIDEVVVHTGQHWDAELSQVFFDELAISPPRYRLDLRTADAAAMEQPIRADDRARAARLGARLRRHELDGSRCARGRNGARGARRGRAPKLRPRNAGGAKPDRGRPARGAAPLPGRALRRAARAGRRGRPARRGRRRDGRRHAPVRARGTRPLDRPRSLRPRAGGIRARDGAPGGERHATGAAPANRRGPAGNRRAAPLPGAPADESGARRPSDRAANRPTPRLSRLRGARRPDPRRRHGLRRPAEGGLLVRHPMRDVAAEHRVGRHRGGGRERARRRRPRRDRGRRPASAAFPAFAPTLYGDGHAAEAIAAALYA